MTRNQNNRRFLLQPMQNIMRAMTFEDTDGLRNITRVSRQMGHISLSVGYTVQYVYIYNYVSV
jgi:hypothetical protein